MRIPGGIAMAILVGPLVYLQSLTYDRFGRPRRITHGNGAVDEHSYWTSAASRFRLTRIRADSGATGLFNYAYATYTATGQIKQVNDEGWTTGQPLPMKATAGYTYDGIGRMTNATSGASNVGIGSRGYTHDEWGNVTSKEGVYLLYADASRPHRLTGFSGGAVGDVEHDDNGNRSLRETFGSATEQHYSYDADDRLARVVIGIEMAGAAAVAYAYDVGGQRRREARGTLTGPGLDVVQPTEIVRHYSDLYDVTTVLGATPTYTARKYYVAGGLLIASRELAVPSYLQTVVADGGPAAGGTMFAAAGAGATGGVELAGVWIGGPVAIVTLSSPAAAVAGGTLLVLIGIGLAAPLRRRPAVVGLRVQPAGAVAVALLVVVGAGPWPLLVRPALAQGGCDPTATPTAVPLPQIHHYHLDHLGSPQTVTDGAGAIVHQVRYDPYGKVRGRWLPTNAAAPNDPQDRREFTGYQLDPISQLSYAGARYYDPVLASFLSHDPMREFANPYTYTNGDPINLADPSGMCIWDLCIAEAIIIGAVVGFAANAIQAAVSGASVGDVFKAGAIGAGIGAVGAGVGFVAGLGVQQGIALTMSQATAPVAAEMIQAAMFVGGIGQAVHGASKGDYSGIAGLGVSIGLGFAISRLRASAAGGSAGADQMLGLFDAKEIPVRENPELREEVLLKLQDPDVRAGARESLTNANASRREFGFESRQVGGIVQTHSGAGTQGHIDFPDSSIGGDVVLTGHTHQNEGFDVYKQGEWRPGPNTSDLRLVRGDPARYHPHLIVSNRLTYVIDHRAGTATVLGNTNTVLGR